MAKNLFLLLFGFICGYLFIKWVSFSIQLTMTEILVNFVLSPLKFFAATVLFMIGIILYGKLFHYILSKMVNIGIKKADPIGSFVICIGMIISFLYLFQLGVWQTSALLCFSILYGMISLIEKTVRTKNNSIG